ncbi:MAG: hypothetical protein KIS74_16480 [Burkholderiales bacterium]|nr:hypothetical protein [Burkholderiales bacterium]
MAVLLITYDLKKPGQSYEDFYEVRNTYAYARLSESSYAVQTDETPKQVYDKLAPHVDKNDRLYVITLSRPYQGWGAKEVNDWLEKRL